MPYRKIGHRAKRPILATDLAKEETKSSKKPPKPKTVKATKEK